MTAIGLDFADRGAAAAPTSQSTVDRGGCDFSGDGRIVDGVAADRSALACPTFYAAILTCAVLIVAIFVIGLFRVVSTRSARLS